MSHFKISPRLLTLIVGALFTTLSVASAIAQTPTARTANAETAVIPIAVLNLRSTGGLDEEQVATINQFLQGQISGLPNYRIIEQAQLTDVMATVSTQQLSGMYDIPIDGIKLTGAQQVILGSVGRLFERVVVSVRLVDLSTGEVAFSYTVHSPEQEVLSQLEEVVQRVREYGLLSFQTITLEDINQLVRRKRYAEAQDRLELYYRQEQRAGRPITAESAQTPQLMAIQEQINANLYQDYLAQARRARRRKDYVDARRMITRAIAIQPTAAALEERDRILIEQEAYNRERETRQRMIELRMAEEQQRTLAGVYLSPLDSIRVYYQQLGLTARRLSVASLRRIDSQLSIPTTLGSTGLQYYQTFSIFSPGDPRMIDSRSVAGITALLDYDSSATEPTISAHAAFSPQLGLAIKFLHVLTTVGVDGGMLVRYGPAIPSGYAFHPTVGASATIDILISRSRGFHLGLRLDHAFQADTSQASPWMARIFAGVTL